MASAARSNRRACSSASRTPSHYGTLCVRERADGAGPEVLLITSRDSGRWVIPKGRPMNGKKGHQVARIEAWEEAGVCGQAEKLPVGHFEYQKTLEAGMLEPCYVQVHRLAVAYVEAIFPEMSQRATRCFTPSEASDHVAEPALAAMLAAL